MHKVERVGVVGWLLLVALGLNLRPILTSISPLLDDIRVDTAMSFQVAALLTTLPVICIGLVALCGAWVEARLGEGRGIALGLLCILFACLSRGLIADGNLLLMSALLGGLGIALIQVLVPGMIKRQFVGGVALAMGVYSASLMGGGGLAALISPRLAHSFGHWQVGLWVWLIPALLAFVLWLKMPWHTPHSLAQKLSWKTFIGNRRAWALAVYFGFCNWGFMTVVAWLPAYYQQLGWTQQASGALLAWMTIFQVTAALSMPVLAHRIQDRRPLLGVSLLAQLLGFSGLLFAPLLAPAVWVGLIGFGLGACFVLCLLLSMDHLHEPRLAGQLAAFVQGFGFLINALAPSLGGLLREVTGSFHSTWQFTVLSLLAMLLMTLRFSPASYSRIGAFTAPSTAHGGQR
ncbi:CynX/NimT family MFS transporter [Pseudomonas marincola]|uniref:CynX/NimT family MFS transporter n=1 Tax=Pseudomonas marincola TaxID=437900 RepID=UPI0008E20C2A|nr:CynX/NimT family MFS transporter [Pseudomonas marincola]SFU16633.1 MFS transporter, CP family, cyanate transporter [Pseudomonas marincola]